MFVLRFTFAFAFVFVFPGLVFVFAIGVDAGVLAGVAAFALLAKYPVFVFVPCRLALFDVVVQLINPPATMRSERHRPMILIFMFFSFFLSDVKRADATKGGRPVVLTNALVCFSDKCADRHKWFSTRFQSSLRLRSTWASLQELYRLL